MHTTRIMTRLVMAIVLAATLFAKADASYSDNFLESSDLAVRRIVMPTGLAYVFTNVAAGEITVSIRQSLRLKRALVVAGGGGGGAYASGGGGGGGVIALDTPVAVASGDMLRLTVGKGGAGGENGGDSSLEINGTSHVAVGGGTGGSWGSYAGVAGGSGGGAVSSALGGAGTAGQGNGGGSYSSSSSGCGGGGATQVGHGGTAEAGGAGGEGLTNDITGVSVVYGSGGGGGGTWGSYAGGKGGTNAGDGGGNDNGYKGTDGVDGTGGGGGGDCFKNNNAYPGAGGCGTVILLLEPPTGLLAVENDSTLVPQDKTDPVAAVDAIQLGKICTAENWTNAETHVVGTCIGHVVRYYDAGTGDWGTPATNQAASFTCPQAAVPGISLTWLWKITLGENAVYRDRLLESSGAPSARDRFWIDAQTCEYLYVFGQTTSEALTLLTIRESSLARALVVAGGGGGGAYASGGGGGGGVIALDTPVAVSSGDMLRLTIGKGGAGGENGGDSSLEINGTSHVAVGGGTGGSWGSYAGVTGGSGGGAVGSAVGGAGTAGQGNGGGSYSSSSSGCGGGGATQVGHGGTAEAGGTGGEGVTNDITGVSIVYGSGGGGGGTWGSYAGGKGGTNAGDGGGNDNGYKATNGVDGTGGGGGGDCFKNNSAYPGAGGCGTVILRFVVRESELGTIILFR